MKGKEHISRRDLLKASVAASGSALLGACATHSEAAEGEYPLSDPNNILYSVCLQCNTGCGIKVKLLDGVAVKIDGNPLAPHCLFPHLPYDTSPLRLGDVDGALCPKGQAGLQTVYDPYRIRKVLKRAGKRGENKWITIDFHQAIKEIVEGGKIFAHVPGEESRVVEGLRSIRALTDPDISAELEKKVKELTKEIKRLRKEKAPEKQIQSLIEKFKKENKSLLPYLIDPNHPDLGTKNNQLALVWGRLKGGREHFIKRWVVDAFGSVNAHGHTTVCQGSLYFTGKAMSEQWQYDTKSHEVKWTGGEKFYWQADTGNGEFIIFVGASPFEANYGPPGRTVRITTRLSEGKLKFAVIDPRLSKTAAKAWKWIPNKPGTEAAIALGMIRWILENKRYNETFLKNANKASAKATGEPSWSNACWLVRIEDGKPGKFLRADEIGLAPPQKRTDEEGNAYEYPLFVCLVNGKPTPVDPNDENTPVQGDLFVNTTLNNIHVKSALQLLKESAEEHTIEKWADIAGISPKDIVDLAKEFTSHGTRAAADIHRGVSQHTNGFYNVFAWYALNLLIGNFDHIGGLTKTTVFNITGEKGGKEIEGKPFNLAKMHPGKIKAFGISLIRHDVKYEDTTLFTGYPAKRRWYPLASDIYQEIIPSIGDAYPYPVKALFLYMGSPVYALPAGHALIPILQDPEKIPLIVASDIVVGETSMYADYIFPDLSYLERWEFHGSHPSFAPKIQPIRNPAIPPVPEEVEVFGEKMPISLEAMLFALAEELNLPGFGPNGFGNSQPFTRPEHLYLKMVANVSAGDKPGDEVPDANDEEIQVFLNARKHLPPSVFDEKVWRASVGEQWWRKVIYVLNRGGRFQNYADAYKGDLVANPYGKLINLYSEKVATTKDSRTGIPFPGIARYIPPYIDSQGNPINDEANGFDLKLITFREIVQTKSRTASNYWLLSILPENFILINRADALKRGLRDGQQVKIVSPSNSEGVWDLGNGKRKPMIGKLKLIEGLRPGCVAFSLGHGHWAYGSEEIVIDGKTIPKDERRGRGIHANAAMRLDPALDNTTLSDPVGASVAFYDSMVKLIPV